MSNMFTLEELETIKEILNTRYSKFIKGTNSGMFPKESKPYLYGKKLELIIEKLDKEIGGDYNEPV